MFPTSIDSHVRTFIRKGIKALLSFKPAFDPPTSTDLHALENTLQLYKNAGLSATVTLWHEAQDMMTPDQFHRVVQYYGRTVRTYYPLAYDAAGSKPANWTNYYPGALLIDVVAVDYYAHTYTKGTRLDTIAGIANHASPPKPFGIWEMGDGKASVTKTQMKHYFHYLQTLMAGRLQAGQANAEIVWFNGNGPDTISSSSDFRVPLWDSLVTATS